MILEEHECEQPKSLSDFSAHVHIPFAYKIIYLPGGYIAKIIYLRVTNSFALSNYLFVL